MPSTLKPEDRVSRYHVVGPLGAGGMGEVYRARDSSLERDVALKILPPDLVRSEERMRRFVLEAKSASSLNHPHIVTIYEIGADVVKSADGSPSPDPDPVHFISMELVSGETLAAKIHEEKIELKILLDWLAQAAEGLAKAHAAGIVHRDLKPGNIMVSRDGYAKVLDFGLAKLVEGGRTTDSEITSAPTMGTPHTHEGAVLGTAGYMSPEQVRGRPVDARSDIFSFGCILYEAATRREPFAADSGVEIMHRILHDTPAKIEDLNPAAPAELRRLIRRCLAKNPEQRLQSMKDVALELREIVDEYESLSASASSASGVRPPLPARRSSPLVPILIGAGVLAAVAVAATMWLRRSQSPPLPSADALQFSQQALKGDAWSAALSSDGRFLAYVTGPIENRTIRVRQIASGSDVEVLTPQPTAPWGLKFSPDGNDLFFLRQDPERPGFTALFQVPALGGSPRKRAFDVDSPVTFSPDGKRLSFRRHLSNQHADNLVLLDLDGDRETVLATVKQPHGLVGAPAWSPDGARLAAAQYITGTNLIRVVTFRLTDGRRDSVQGEAWAGMSHLTWLPNGRSLVLTANETATSPGQVWIQSFTSGRRSRITNDGYDYQWVSLTADGSLLAAQRNSAVVNVWSVEPAPPHNLRQLTSITSVENTVIQFNVALSGALYYVTRRNDLPQVFMIPPGGGDERQLTSGNLPVVSIRSLPDGGVIFGRPGDDGKNHIWRTDADGGNTRPITNGAGEFIRSVSLDGRLLVFERSDKLAELWIMSTDGGEPRLLSPANSSQPLFSRDSRWIALQRFRPNEAGRFDEQIVSAADGKPLATLTLPLRAQNMQLTPDARAISFLDEADSSMNVHVQPIDGPARQLTSFREGRVLDHRWARDGNHLMVTRRIGSRTNLWSLSPDGRNPIQLTDFPTGEIFGSNTPASGRPVLFAYGAQHADVVLIRGLR